MVKRDIVFRGRRINDNVWVYGFLAGPCQIIEQNGVTLHVVDPSTIGQYTGVHDRDGRRIFEDDLVYTNGQPVQFRTIDLGVTDCPSPSHTGVVKYDEDLCQFNISHATMKMHQYLIVGNIHDTPGLITDIIAARQRVYQNRK